MIPIVIGALGCVSKNLGKWIDKLGIKVKTECLQKTALLGTSRILRKVLGVLGTRRKNLRDPWSLAKNNNSNNNCQQVSNKYRLSFFEKKSGRSFKEKKARFQQRNF